MRLVLTGGGTGGHIYPALVVGERAREDGAELLYFGSIRGQEYKACESLGISFTGFPSEPLYSLRTLRGLRALIRLQQSRLRARVALRSASPNAVFSTGGYSAGPIVAAAKDLGIPYVIHTSDSIPARSSSMFAQSAFAFTCTFRSTFDRYKDRELVRTGQPIRKELRIAASVEHVESKSVLVVGGSQGSAFLNETIPNVAKELHGDVQFLHACGPTHFESTSSRVSRLGLGGRYRVVPYLQTDEMVEAYRNSAVVVARSGGTLAEIALFGLPSVLVPLPNSANDHQLFNAKEFEQMSAATIHLQTQATPQSLAASILEWMENPSKRAVAKANLQAWDVPDAADRIWNLIQEAKH